MYRQFLAERNLIPDDVVTDPSQFVAQRLGGHTGIGLGRLAIVICPEVLVVSAAQVGRLHECPAQISIAVFTVTVSLGFAIRQALR